MIGFAPLLDTDTFGYYFLSKKVQNYPDYQPNPEHRLCHGEEFLTHPSREMAPMSLSACDHWPAEHRKLCLSRFSLKPGEKARSFVCVFVLNISGQRRILWTICHKGSLFLKIKDMIFSFIFLVV